MGSEMCIRDSDLLGKYCLSNRVEVFRSEPSCDFHIFPSEQFRNVPGDLGLPWFRKSDDDLAGFFDKPLWQTTAAIWSTESIKRLGGFREDLLAWQDWDLFVRALIGDLRYTVHDVAADNFVRRSLHDRISANAERDQRKLKNRTLLFRDLFQSLTASGKLNEQREKSLIELFKQLAIKMRISGLSQESDQWLAEMVDMKLLPESLLEPIKSEVKKQSKLTLRQRINEFKLSLLRMYHRING